MRLNSSQKFFLLGLISAGLPASKIKQTFFDRYVIRLTSPAISYHKKRRGIKGNAGRPLKTTSAEDQVIYEVQEVILVP